MSFSNFLSMFKPGGGVPGVTHDEMRAASAKGEAAIVDVREPGEFASGRIPGSVNLPLSRFDANRLPKDKPVIFVCATGARSGTAARHVMSAGRQDVRHYAPGMMGWRRFGEKIV